MLKSRMLHGSTSHDSGYTWFCVLKTIHYDKKIRVSMANRKLPFKEKTKRITSIK